MRKTIIACVCAVFLATSMSGCYTLRHTVGTGSAGGASVSETQWYVLWGLVPLGQADSKAMAGGSSNYTVDTGMSFVDCLLSMVLNIIPTTVTRQTVTVTK